MSCCIPGPLIYIPSAPLHPSLSALWLEHHIRQWDHLLPGLPRGVPQLSRLLLADHRGSWLRHQSQLHPASGSRAARLHHCLVRNYLDISDKLPFCLWVKLNCILSISLVSRPNPFKRNVAPCTSTLKCYNVYLFICGSIL